MNSNMSAIGGGISMQTVQQQSQQQNTSNAIVKPPSIPQILNPSLHQQMQNHQDRVRHNMSDQPQLLQHQISNHLSVGSNLNHGLNNNSGLSTMQMTQVSTKSIITYFILCNV